MVLTEEKSTHDIEAGPCEASIFNQNDESLHFSDADGEHFYSPNDTQMVDEYRLSRESIHEISRIHEPSKSLRISDSSVDLVLEGNVEKPEKDCRICHLGLQSHSKESGIPIVLGCSCKDDLAAAHKQCAETWFKIKGNQICEICGATAMNVSGGAETQFTENWNDTSNTSAPNSAAQTEARRFWQGHHFLNFLLACMVFAFIISSLLRFNGRG